MIFENYKYEYDVPRKQRDPSQLKRVINNLDQELPSATEWEEFLHNDSNKHQLINILVNYILSNESNIDKEIYINNGNECFLKYSNNNFIRFEELDSMHREADQKIPMHAVYAGKSSDDTIIVVSDDTDVCLSLLYVSHLINSKLYFRKGKVKDKNGIMYNDIHSLAGLLGNDICHVLLCFHALTGSDFTNPFFGRSKKQSFCKMQKTPDSHKLLLTMTSEIINIDEITKFILHIIYNRPLKEKSPGESRYRMFLTRKASSKTFPSSKSIPPDKSSLKMKILRASFVSHCRVNCLNALYVPFNPSNYGWKLISDDWEPRWFEGNSLPDFNEMNSGLIDVPITTQMENSDVLESNSGDDNSDESDYVESCNESESDSEL